MFPKKDTGRFVDCFRARLFLVGVCFANDDITCQRRQRPSTSGSKRYRVTHKLQWRTLYKADIESNSYKITFLSSLRSQQFFYRRKCV